MFEGNSKQSLIRGNLDSAKTIPKKKKNILEMKFCVCVIFIYKGIYIVGLGAKNASTKYVTRKARKYS